MKRWEKRQLRMQKNALDQQKVKQEIHEINLDFKFAAGMLVHLDALNIARNRNRGIKNK